MAQSRLGTRAASVFPFAWRRSFARVSSLIAVMALTIVTAAALRHVLETSPSRGPAIRVALIAAAAKTRSMPATASQGELRDAIGQYFRSFHASVDASRYPTEMDITLRDIDGVTCLEVEDEARRIEGTVVVQLEGYQSADACRRHNDMTWRLMP